MKKFVMAFMAALLLVSCGNAFVEEIVGVYEDGAAKASATKTMEELDATVADVTKQVSTIKEENKEEWSVMVEENRADSTEHADDFASLGSAESKFMGAVNAKRAELIK